MIRAFSCIALAACGRIGFSTHEIATDGGSGDASCALVDWDDDSVTLTRLDSLNMPAVEDWEPAVSPDGLVIVFGSFRGPSESELWFSTRGSIDEGFPAPSLIPNFGRDLTMDVYGPAWSLDGTRLYYAHGAAHMVAPYVNGVFGTPQASNLPAYNPVFLTDDEIFATNNDRFNDYDLVHWTFDGTDWNEQQIPSSYNRIGEGLSDGWPTYDRTAGFVYFEHADATGAGVLARAHVSAGELPEVFETLPQLGSDLGDPDISPDGRRMYVGARRVNADNDIYMFERGCQ